MSLSVLQAAANRLVRALTRRKGVGPTEAVQHVVGAEFMHLDREPSLRSRAATIRRSILGRERSGERADKAFFDDLNDND
jgi:hypothetical protein